MDTLKIKNTLFMYLYDIIIIIIITFIIDGKDPGYEDIRHYF